MIRWRTGGPVALLLLSLAGCASAPPPSSPAAAEPITPADLVASIADVATGENADVAAAGHGGDAAVHVLAHHLDRVGRRAGGEVDVGAAGEAGRVPAGEQEGEEDDRPKIEIPEAPPPPRKDPTTMF